MQNNLCVIPQHPPSTRRGLGFSFSSLFPFALHPLHRLCGQMSSPLSSLGTGVVPVCPLCVWLEQVLRSLTGVASIKFLCTGG